MAPCKECTEHSAYDIRTKRNEKDVQTLFDKLGEAIGLMYDVKNEMTAVKGKLSNYWAKMVGIWLGASTAVVVVLKLVSMLPGDH